MAAPLTSLLLPQQGPSLCFGSFASGPEALSTPLTLARLPGSTAQALP